MRKKKNVKSEANWSVWRRDAAPGYENLFQWGVANDIYHNNDPLERCVFYDEIRYRCRNSLLCSALSFDGLQFHGCRSNLTVGWHYGIKLLHEVTSTRSCRMASLNLYDPGQTCTRSPIFRYATCLSASIPYLSHSSCYRSLYLQIFLINLKRRMLLRTIPYSSLPLLPLTTGPINSIRTWISPWSHLTRSGTYIKLC